jgi:SAM-dependent methyltransferase
MQLEPNTYDLVVAQMCVHHIEALERLFEQVTQALVPNGVFAINDYVGPTRWQFTPMQLLLANVLIWLLPLRLRVRYPDGKLKKGIRRSTVKWMIKMDPSEAVRSDEIVPLFGQFFKVEHCIDYGGSISIPVLDCLVANFRQDDPVSLRWFKRILDVDHWARHSGLVPTINVVLAGRPRRA